MYNQVGAFELGIALAAVGLGLYYWTLYRSGILRPKKVKVTSSQNQTDTAIADIIPRQLIAKSETDKMSLPPAITSSLISEHELEAEDAAQLEFLDDNDGSALLKEAEKVVDGVQDTINHIASSPPNPEEVFSKIKCVVSPYKLLLETEYYDSINTYIALAVERDCGIKLSSEELQALWN